MYVWVLQTGSNLLTIGKSLLRLTENVITAGSAHTIPAPARIDLLIQEIDMVFEISNRSSIDSMPRPTLREVLLSTIHNT